MPYLFYRSFYDFSRLFLPEVITVSKFSKINMVIFALFLLGLAFYIFSKRSRRSIIDNIFTEDNFVLVISFLTLAAVVFLYGIRVFSIDAMSVKALMLVSPLLFVVLAQILLYLNKIPPRLIYIILLFNNYDPVLFWGPKNGQLRDGCKKTFSTPRFSVRLSR